MREFSEETKIYLAFLFVVFLLILYSVVYWE
jgi:hypothetical protein